MRNLVVPGIAVVYAVAVAALDRQGWASLLIGAILALVLWVMLFAGSYAGPQHGVVTPEAYGTAAVVALAVGWGLVALMGLDSPFWAVGAIVGGAIAPTAGLARRDRPAA